MEQETIAVLERLEKYNKQQARAAKTQCIISVVSMLCCVAALAMVLRVVPQIVKVTNQTQQFISSAEDVLKDVQQVTGNLSEVDMGPVLQFFPKITKALWQF